MVIEETTGWEGSLRRIWQGDESREGSTGVSADVAQSFSIRAGQMHLATRVVLGFLMYSISGGGRPD